MTRVFGSGQRFFLPQATRTSGAISIKKKVISVYHSPQDFKLFSKIWNFSFQKYPPHTVAYATQMTNTTETSNHRKTTK